MGLGELDVSGGIPKGFGMSLGVLGLYCYGFRFEVSALLFLVFLRLFFFHLGL